MQPDLRIVHSNQFLAPLIILISRWRRNPVVVVAKIPRRHEGAILPKGHIVHVRDGVPAGYGSVDVGFREVKPAFRVRRSFFLIPSAGL